MIVWGSKGKTKTIAQGRFFCPSCRTSRPYEHKQVGRYFTLYFIPLFQTKDIGEFVECQVCHMTFKPEIINASRKIEDEIRLDNKRREILDEISQQLDAGLSIQAIVIGLRNAGIDDDAIAFILQKITDGLLRNVAIANLLIRVQFNSAPPVVLRYLLQSIVNYNV